MQKQKLIPTPLFDVSRRKPVEIVATEMSGSRRLFRVIVFVISTIWLWWRTTLELRFRGTADTRAGARRIRQFMEEMGGMWIKAGQFMGMRRDLYTPETCDELAKLQDHARGFPFAYVRRAIEEDLGAPIEQIFSEFNEVPVAAASIGQTHMARLRQNGVKVAVKVQRPSVGKTLTRDLWYLEKVASWLHRSGIGAHQGWEEMVWELRKTLTEELDYRMEASAIQRMRKQLRRQKVYAPKVFSKYCSARVLVMEFIEGVFMSDYIKAATEDPERVRRWAEENNVDPYKVGERLYLMHLRQLHEYNLFHADLHPGNIVLQRDSRFVLIDFGSVGSVDKSRRNKFRMMITAMAESDHEKFVELMVLVAPPLPSNTDVAALKAACMRVLRVWEKKTSVQSLPYSEKCSSAAYRDIFKVQQAFGMTTAWDFLLITRADLTLDASLMFLCPDVDYIKLLKKFDRLSRERVIKRVSNRTSIRNAVAELTSAAQLPKALGENILFEGEWLRKRAMGFQGHIGRFSEVVQSFLSVLRLGVLTAVGLAIGAYLRQVVKFSPTVQSWTIWSIYDLLPNFATPAWVAVGVVGVYLLFMVTRLRTSLTTRAYDRPGAGTSSG